jgi:hypothetical protein
MKCKNDSTKSYKGDEPSPKGLGYSASAEEVDCEMLGKDGNLWIVSQTKTCKRWLKQSNKLESKPVSKPVSKPTPPKPKNIDFDDLYDDCYTIAFIPRVSKNEIEVETGLEDKFGGNKPFFIEGEKWPLSKDELKEPMKLICQFKDPRKKDNILRRVFTTMDEDSDDLDPEFRILDIELSEENLKKQVVLETPSFKTPYKPYIIEFWGQATELKPKPYIMLKYGYDRNSSKYHDEYYESRYFPSMGIKIGGTPMYTQYEGDYLGRDGFLQLSEAEFLPYGWGDCGIAHIDERGNLDWDCC